jgi:hypothetical protein
MDAASAVASASSSGVLDSAAASSATIPLASSSRHHIAAAGDGHCDNSSAFASAALSKRASEGARFRPSTDDCIGGESASRGAAGVDGGSAAKRTVASASTPLPIGSPPRGCGSGSSSPVSAIMSKRASDDIEHKAGGGRAVEKRTNDGGGAGQRERRNSD